MEDLSKALREVLCYVFKLVFRSMLWFLL